MSKNNIKQVELNWELEEELRHWNDDDVAFIKNDVMDGKEMWLICAADGTKLAATDNRDFAFIMAKQNDLKPTSVH